MDREPRTCARKGCGVVFQPKKAWQIFHDRHCRDMHHNSIKAEAMALLRQKRHDEG